jgi:hypothetical protein
MGSTAATTEVSSSSSKLFSFTSSTSPAMTSTVAVDLPKGQNGRASSVGSCQSKGAATPRPAVPRKLSKEEVKQSRELGATILRVLDLTNAQLFVSRTPSMSQCNSNGPPIAHQWIRSLAYAERRRARARKSSGRRRREGGTMSTLAEVSETASAT